LRIDLDETLRLEAQGAPRHVVAKPSELFDPPHNRPVRVDVLEVELRVGRDAVGEGGPRVGRGVEAADEADGLLWHPAAQYRVAAKATEANLHPWRHSLPLVLAPEEAPPAQEQNLSRRSMVAKDARSAYPRSRGGQPVARALPLPPISARTSQRNIEIVRGAFDALQRGDIPATLAHAHSTHPRSVEIRL